jgi:hypothetical protein
MNSLDLVFKYFISAFVLILLNVELRPMSIQILIFKYSTIEIEYINTGIDIPFKTKRTLKRQDAYLIHAMKVHSSRRALRKSF